MEAVPENLQCRASNMDPRNLCNCQLLEGHDEWHENFDQGIRYRWRTIPALTPNDLGGPRKPLSFWERFNFERVGKAGGR